MGDWTGYGSHARLLDPQELLGVWDENHWD